MKIAVTLVVIGACFCAFRSSVARHVPGDFLRYHRAGRLVATDLEDKLYRKKFRATDAVYAKEREEDLAARGDDADDYPERPFKYLPATAVLLAPLGSLHPRTANVIWGGWNGLLIGLMLLLLWKDGSFGRSGWWMLIPGVILFRVINDNLNLGQLNPSAIIPATLSMLVLARSADPALTLGERRFSSVGAGLLAAFGGVVKFMPAFLGVWFLWKRRYLAFASLLAGLVLIGYVLPLATLGSETTHDLHKRYYEERASIYTSDQPSDLPGHSIKSLVYRLFGGVPYEKYGMEVDVGVATLPPKVVLLSVTVLNLMALFWVFRVTGRTLRSPSDPRSLLEIGMMLSLLLLVSPEARGPHFLYLSAGVIALTYALVRLKEDPTSPRFLKPLLIVGGVGGLLLNTNSTTLFGKKGAALLGAFCPLLFANLICMVGITLVLRHYARGVDSSGEIV